MQRRKLLRSGLQSLIVLPFSQPLLGHTPFPQWKVYRQRHLFIAVDRSDLPAYELGQTLVSTLNAYLPEAEAKVTRAVDAVGVASLISTEQIDVALLQTPVALDWVDGGEKFQAIEPVPLRTLVNLGDYLLLCRANFPNHHAHLIASTIVDHVQPILQDTATSALLSPSVSEIPLHPGVLYDDQVT